MSLYNTFHYETDSSCVCHSILIVRMSQPHNCTESFYFLFYSEFKQICKGIPALLFNYWLGLLNFQLAFTIFILSFKLIYKEKVKLLSTEHDLMKAHCKFVNDHTL